MLGDHLLGLYEKALPHGWDWPRRLSTARSLGFDYLEISIDETDERIARLHWDAARRHDLTRAVRDAGIPIRSMCLSAHRRFPFGSRNADTRATAAEIMKRAIEFADDLGIRVIQLAGYDVYYEESTEVSRAAFADGLHQAADWAARYCVMLGMEIMDTQFLNSISKSLAYEQELSCPWYRLYPDVGNLSAWDNDVPLELERGIASIVAVHLKDTHAVSRTHPGTFKGVRFGSGCVDFKAVFATLESLSYRGPYMMELWAGEERDAVNEVRRSRQFIEEQFAAAMSPAGEGE